MSKRTASVMMATICVMLIVACASKDSCGPDAQYLPGQSGAKWLLTFSNNIDKQDFDITINIEASTVMDDGKEAEIWAYSRNGVVLKRSYVVETDEAVTAYSGKDASHIDWMYSLPFEIGKNWLK